MGTFKTYLVKATWHATSKTLKIQATSEAKALEQASKSRDTKGCTSLAVVGKRDAD